MSCDKCNTILLKQIDFNTNKNNLVCVYCNNIDPRNKEIVNATPLLFFNSAIDINKKYPQKLDIPELFPIKEIETIESKWSPSIQQNILLSNSAKPSFPLIDISEKEAQKTYNKRSGNIIIDWSPVIGYNEIKHIIDAALANQGKKKTHILIVGAAGTSKTVFLKTIEESMQSNNLNVHYLDATTLSSAGVIQYLFDNTVDYCLLDEIDKLEKEHQRVFLNMLESGVLQETKGKKNGIRKKDMKHTVFIATGNYIEKIMFPLLTRFLTLNIPEYTKDQFMQIGTELLNKQYGKSKEIAAYITKQVYNIYVEVRKEKPNLRNCVQVATLTNNSKESIDPILNGLTKFAQRYNE